ncbi:unnamed protein product [Cylindrotheca closterium]|uniref:Helicase-associated domain-containing protein n=1 Tax=Cylindrotheca closterium TaxID=2856 RepID=A0AAD2FN15_9STRA|nr:unnamed protein product [Cylindrotheca closterium]
MEKDNLYSMLGVMDQSVFTSLPRGHQFQDLSRANPQLQMTAASLFHCGADFEPTPINENSAAFGNRSGARPNENQLLRQVLNQANTVIDAENDFTLYGNSLGLSPSLMSSNHPQTQSAPVVPTAATSSSETCHASTDLHPDTAASPTESTAAASEEASPSTISQAVTSGRWYDRYQDLIQFKKEHGHCCVPSHWPKNPPLAQWVKRQRHQYKRSNEGLHSTITPARIEALNKMTFVWDPHSAFWEERLNELYEFRDKYGHCNVPTKFPDNPQLAIWAKCQRRQFKLFVSDGPKRSNMTVDRIAKLSRVGFVFNPRQINKRRA